MTTHADAKRDAIRAQVEEELGFVPNVINEMLVSPVAAQAYLKGQALMGEATLSARDQQIVQLAVAVHNGCNYCSAAHAALAKAEGVSAEDVKAIRAGELPADPDLAGLVGAARLVMDKRGRLGAEDLASLKAHGIGREQLYEIITLVALKTITNYINHIAHTQIDEAFTEGGG